LEYRNVNSFPFILLIFIVHNHFSLFRSGMTTCLMVRLLKEKVIKGG